MHQEANAATGRKVISAEGPSEIASRFFPHEEEKGRRIALRTAIEKLLARRIAEVVGMAEFSRKLSRRD
jgi:signal recognition particle subunit SEC65